MKKLLILLVYLTVTISYSQVQPVTGIVKDVTTLLPVETATVSVSNSNITTVTNQDGQFRIAVPVGAKEIKISHLSFKDYTLKINDGKSDREIFLEPSNIILEDVVVSNISTNDILLQVVKNSKSHLEKTLLLNTYYREIVNINGVYTKFADGLLDYNIKKKGGSADLYVKQSRSFKLMDDQTAEREKTTDALYMFDVKKAVSEAYDFKRINNILESRHYDYEHIEKKDADGKAVRIVKIIPKADSQISLFEGTVTYDPETDLILEIDVQKSEAHKQYAAEVNALFFRFKINDEARKSIFKIDGDKYILIYNQNRMNVYVNMKDKFNDTFDFMSDLVTMDYKEGEFDLDKNNRYKERSLFASGNKYEDEYWKTSNIMLLTEEEENLLKKLQ